MTRKTKAELEAEDAELRRALRSAKLEARLWQNQAMAFYERLPKDPNRPKRMLLRIRYQKFRAQGDGVMESRRKPNDDAIEHFGTGMKVRPRQRRAPAAPGRAGSRARCLYAHSDELQEPDAGVTQQSRTACVRLQEHRHGRGRAAGPCLGCPDRTLRNLCGRDSGSIRSQVRGGGSRFASP